MSKGTYSGGKRQRDAEKARKKREKAERRWAKRERGTGEVPIADLEDVTGDLVAIEAARRAERAAVPKGAKAIPARLFVGSLDWNTSDEDLRTLFGEFGVVSEAVVVCDRDSGKSRGFGFVVMENRKDAYKAIDALDGSELHNRQIVVNVATERQR